MMTYPGFYIEIKNQYVPLSLNVGGVGFL